MATNCCVSPAAIEGFAGATESDTRAGAVTVSVVDPEIEPKAAPIVAAPWPALEAKPAALIVATAPLAELQVTEPVRSCLLLSVYTPVAANCCFKPNAIDGLAGLTEMEASAYPIPLSATL